MLLDLGLNEEHAFSGESPLLSQSIIMPRMCPEIGAVFYNRW